MGEVTRLGGLIGAVTKGGGMPGLPDRVTFLTSVNRCLILPFKSFKVFARH